MRHLAFAACAALALLAAVPAASAQSTTSPAQPAGAVATSPTSRFVMQNGEVVLVQEGRPTPLTKNVLLADGTKINYKSGIVELPGGKKTTLKEGDYVRPDGGIVFATPASAAAARNEPAAAGPARFEPYVDPRPDPTSPAALRTRLNELDTKISLMAEKIQLLNQKISLLSTNAQRPTDTSALDQQIQKLDEKLK
ncbi:DUF6799 domain-containing protein [Hymenobacter weizhouensis]|uniref:DUF6799 domain-containing protein n=1 Tax=Hymenobacter sp. YIM 151500-1 TaxID=2987689 RepID=UPI002226A8AD|nr:DUF6799 domain-containing protein [Hymenobacter sp. YIM 151500-1]UYZ65038.1 hypothetical protein OIS53_09330 [Hymenobacter sp. YIM 151500-1]